jgi:hypothetical protein
VSFTGGGGTGAACASPTVTAAAQIAAVNIELWDDGTIRLPASGTIVDTNGNPFVAELMERCLSGSGGVATNDRFFGVTI